MANILVVDDDPDIRYVAALLLRRGGHQPTVVEGALQALAFLDGGGKCDLILCDRMMPSMSGLQLLIELRKRPMAQPRFLFLSARVEDEEMAEGLRQGADGYVPKPFETQALLAEIKRLCASAGG